MKTTFSALGVHAAHVERLKQYGLTTPTPVQQQTIPLVLAGKDVIAQAQTGTGKTLAFVLPMLQTIVPQKRYIQGLIVTPTRELAIQISAEIRKLIPDTGLGVLAAYGGQDVEGQIRKLQNSPHIVVATPGRLLDHVRRGTVELTGVSMLVLDEADQMLDMGFLNEVVEIIELIPSRRQTMLFSATMPDAVRRLAAGYMRQPEDVRILGKQITLENIRQQVIMTTDRARQQTLIELIEQHNPFLAVVFCRTKIRAKKLTEALQQHGLDVDELHGDLTQAKREQVMKRFRDAKIQVLVATDVAARGLDVEGVTHVFNYDVPRDKELYIHRIGRTGRAGQKGMAITLASPRDSTAIQHLEKGIGANLVKLKLDSTGSAVTTEAGKARQGGSRTNKDRQAGTKRTPQRPSTAAPSRQANGRQEKPQPSRRRGVAEAAEQPTRRAAGVAQTSRRSNSRPSASTADKQREQPGKQQRARNTRTSEAPSAPRRGGTSGNLSAANKFAKRGKRK